MKTVRERRTAAKLSQENLARLAGCSVSYVRQLDHGFVPHGEARQYERVLAVLEENERPATTPDARNDRLQGSRHEAA